MTGLIFIKDFIADNAKDFQFKIDCGYIAEGNLLKGGTLDGFYEIDNVILLDGKKHFYRNVILDSEHVIALSEYREKQINSILYD